MENKTNVNRKIVNGRIVDSRVSGGSRQSGVSSVSVRPSVESLGNSKFPRSSYAFRNTGPNRPGTGHSTLNTAMSRGSFLRTAGAVGGAVAAAGLGLGGVARAEDNIIPEYIAGGGNNYNVWPIGDLEVYSFPDPYNPSQTMLATTDAYNIEWAVANARDGGVVRLKAHDKLTNELKAFEFGSGTVRILNKSITIIGSDDYGKPMINGSSAGKSNVTVNSGIFHVTAKGKSVRFQNVDLNHSYGLTSGDQFGSGTIIGSGSSSFRVISCNIDTNTTSAILLRTLDTTGEILVSNCKIKGRSFKVGSLDKGNFSSVNIGSFGQVDLRGGVLQVTDCDMDSGIFVSIGIFNFLSDPGTKYILQNNRIGYDSPLYSESNAFGILLGYPTLSGSPFPLGTAVISGNAIRLNRYHTTNNFDTSTGGIGVSSLNINSAIPSLDALISNNSIVFSQTINPKYLPFPPLNPLLHPAFPFDAIVIDDLGSVPLIAEITGNTLASAPGSVLAKRGITLGMQNALLQFNVSKARNVYVHDNDYSGLNVSIAKVYIGPQSTYNTVTEPSLACSDISNNGTDNTITAYCGLCLY